VQRSVLTITAIGVALAAVTAACSSSDTGSSSPTSAANASAATVDSAVKGKTLTLATDANYPPCESFEGNSKKTMIGFEPEIWDAIAQRIGVTLKVENTQFDNLIPGVQSGRYDLAMECISDRAERQKQVTFVDFIYAETSVVTRADYTGPVTADDPLSICGLKMGAQSGFDTISFVQDTINPACEKAGKTKIDVKAFPSAADTYNALYSSRVDFIILDSAAAAYLNKSAPVQLKRYANSLLEKLYLGAIFKPADTDLQNAWLAGLKAIVGDGTYAATLKKWDIADLALTDPGINLATTRPIAKASPAN
jgi:polar amino acid transport system substrate-binding protein